MERIMIELPAKWVRFAQSPIRIVLAAFTCLSLTFAPVFLFLRGKAGLGLKDPVVLVCFAAIFLMPLIHIRFASILLSQIRNSTSAKPASTVWSRNALLFWMGAVLAAMAIYLLFRS